VPDTAPLPAPQPGGAAAGAAASAELQEQLRFQQSEVSRLATELGRVMYVSICVCECVCGGEVFQNSSLYVVRHCVC